MPNSQSIVMAKGASNKEAVKTSVIVEANVVLRPISPADRPLLVRWQTDPRIMTGWALPQPVRPHNAFEEQIAGEFCRFDHAGSFLIEGDRVPVGRIHYDDLDARHRSVEIGIYIGEPEAQGNGYAGNAIKAISKYLIRQRGAHRIELNTLTWNTRAHDLYLRLGFRDEGILRDHIYFDGRWHGEYQMALLASDSIEWLNNDLPPAYLA